MQYKKVHNLFGLCKQCGLYMGCPKTHLLAKKCITFAYVEKKQYLCGRKACRGILHRIAICRKIQQTKYQKHYETDY